jgi:hypothetical protein
MACVAAGGRTARPGSRHEGEHGRLAALPFVVSCFERRRTALHLDATRVRLGDVPVPWAVVTEFGVPAPPDRPHTLTGARLRPEALSKSRAALPPRHPALPAPFHVAATRSRFEPAETVCRARVRPPPIRTVVAEPSCAAVAADTGPSTAPVRRTAERADPFPEHHDANSTRGTTEHDLPAPSVRTREA